MTTVSFDNESNSEDKLVVEMALHDDSQLFVAIYNADTSAGVFLKFDEVKFLAHRLNKWLEGINGN